EGPAAQRADTRVLKLRKGTCTGTGKHALDGSGSQIEPGFFDLQLSLGLGLLALLHGQCPNASGLSETSYAATTLMRPVLRDRGFRRMTISMSWSSAVSRFIKRSTEKPASL